MNATMKDFLENAAEVLEVPEARPGDDFRAYPMWNSMAAFSLMVMVEQRYGRILSAADVARCATVGDLAAAAGVAQ